MARINLLKKTDSYVEISTLFSRIKIIFFTLLFIGLLSVSALSLANGITTTQKVSAESEQADVLNQLGKTQKSEAEILIFSNKYKQYKELLKEDARFLPYYKLIEEAVNAEVTKAKIENAKIDKSRTFTFNARFDNYVQFANFFSYVETENFLKNFETIKLTSLSIGNVKEKQEYELEFNGKFLEINDEKI
jgi:hypothetical protein